MSHLKEIAEYEKEDFYPICAAEIYDDYFRQVCVTAVTIPAYGLL